MSEFLTIRKPDDFHVHFRDFPEAADYIRDAKKSFARALAMPNTSPPIDSVERLVSYRQKVIECSGGGFSPLMSFKVIPKMDPRQVNAFKSAGALIGKLYPRGVTTNSDEGAESLEEFYLFFEAMEQADLVLSVHGEDPFAPVFQRERSFLKSLEAVINNFPKLRVVMEHLSTEESVAFIQGQESRIAATLTVQHLWFSMDELMGGAFNPHLFCKPILQTPRDREALRQAAFSGDSHFFFGSDSAPHPIEKKESGKVAAGSYSSPVALEALTTLFDLHDQLPRLEDFTSSFGADFYRLNKNDEKITLKKESWKVPSQYHGVVPLFANQELAWKVQTDREGEERC